MNCIALDTTAFNQTEFEMIQNLRNGILKIDAFLKKLIRKGNHQCTLFLEGLRQTRHAEIVHVITEPENSGKFNKSKRFCQPCTGSHGKQTVLYKNNIIYKSVFCIFEICLKRSNNVYTILISM